MQVLVDYKEWGDLVELGLRNPGERGKNLEDVLRELVAEADRNPSGNAPEYIRRVLDEIAKENSLAEVLCYLEMHSCITLQCVGKSCLDVVDVFVGVLAVSSSLVCSTCLALHPNRK